MHSSAARTASHAHDHRMSIIASMCPNQSRTCAVHVRVSDDVTCALCLWVWHVRCASRVVDATCVLLTLDSRPSHVFTRRGRCVRRCQCPSAAPGPCRATCWSAQRLGVWMEDHASRQEAVWNLRLAIVWLSCACGFALGCVCTAARSYGPTLSFAVC